MKFKVKPYPKDGDVRIITRFALFPVRLDCNIVVWLERYKIKVKYCEVEYPLTNYWATISTTKYS